jgi:hypothetical protein
MRRRCAATEPATYFEERAGAATGLPMVCRLPPRTLGLPNAVLGLLL